MVANAFISITGARPLTSQNMSDELNENLNSQQVADAVLDTQTEAIDSTMDAETLAEKNRQLYARATKAEAEAKELKAKLKPTENLQTNQSSPNSDERFERLELKTEGFSTEEVDFLMRNGGKAAINDKLVMAGIESIRKAAKSVEATPSGTNKSTVFQKYTEQDLKKMSAEDLEKIVPQG